MNEAFETNEEDQVVVDEKLADAVAKQEEAAAHETPFEYTSLVDQYKQMKQAAMSEATKQENERKAKEEQQRKLKEQEEARVKAEQEKQKIDEAKKLAEKQKSQQEIEHQETMEMIQNLNVNDVKPVPKKVKKISSADAALNRIAERLAQKQLAEQEKQGKSAQEIN